MPDHGRDAGPAAGGERSRRHADLAPGQRDPEVEASGGQAPEGDQAAVNPDCDLAGAQGGDSAHAAEGDLERSRGTDNGRGKGRAERVRGVPMSGKEPTEAIGVIERPDQG